MNKPGGQRDGVCVGGSDRVRKLAVDVMAIYSMLVKTQTAIAEEVRASESDDLYKAQAVRVY